MASDTCTGLGLTVSKQNQGGKRSRLEIRAEECWVARIEAQAARLGMTASAYIRAAVTRALEADESTDPTTHKRTGRKPPPPA